MKQKINAGGHVYLFLIFSFVNFCLKKTNYLSSPCKIFFYLQNMASCLVCQKQAITLYECAGECCEKPLYCGKECQRNHWPEHQLVCLGGQISSDDMRLLVKYMKDRSIGRDDPQESETSYEERLQLSISRMKKNDRIAGETDDAYAKRIAKQLKTNLSAQRRNTRKRQEESSAAAAPSSRSKVLKDAGYDFDDLDLERIEIVNRRQATIKQRRAEEKQWTELMAARKAEEAKWAEEESQWAKESQMRKAGAPPPPRAPVDPLQGVTALEDMAALFRAGKVTKTEIERRLRVLWDNETGFGKQSDEIATVQGEGVYRIVMNYVEDYDSDEDDWRKQSTDFALVYNLLTEGLSGPLDISDMNRMDMTNKVVLYSK